MSEITLRNAPDRSEKPVLKPSKSAILSRDFSACGPEGIRVTLPVGIRTGDGECVRNAWIEPLTGNDEEWLVKVNSYLTLPEWVSGLINHKMSLKGNFSYKDRASRLSVADRDMLILYLRMLTFGPEIWGITSCPYNGCDSKLDFTFDLTTLEIPSIKNRENEYSTLLDYQSQKRHFSYREPDGADQVAIAVLVHTEPYRALLELLTRCLIHVEGLSEISTVTLGKLPQELLLEMDTIIAGGITTFDWDVELICPECQRNFIGTLDIQAFFWEELQISMGDFWEEVHQLAFYYHWSEAAILSLTRWRRKMYLGHIQRHLKNRAVSYQV